MEIQLSNIGCEVDVPRVGDTTNVYKVLDRPTFV